MLEPRRFIRSFRYSFKGFQHVLKNHQNIRFHLVVAVLVLLLAVLLRISRIEFLLVLIAIVFVVIAEMINTAIEEITNLVTKEYREEARIAKDVAAATVFLASIFSVILGLIIFIPYLLKY